MNAERRPDRRRLLRWVGLGALAAAGAALAVPGARAQLAWNWKRLREGLSSPAARLRRHFDYLDLDPAGVDAYVADWAKHVGPLPRWDAAPQGFHTRYLLSTDFFRNGADESRTLRYVAYCDPRVSICSNPLARFDE